MIDQGSPPDEEILAEFKRRQKKQWMTLPFAMLAMILLVSVDEQSGLGLGGLPAMPLSIAAIVLILGVMAFSLKNWRCPTCNAYLGRGMAPRYCRKCGVQLKR